MPPSESEEHSELKRLVKQKLTEWFQGLVLKEYQVAGHQADVYGVTQDGATLHVEIVWTPERFYPNLMGLLVSDATVRCMIWSERTRQKHGEEYDRIRLEQLRKRILLTEAFRAEPLLALDPAYMEQVRAHLQKSSRSVPAGAAFRFPRSFWYINAALADQILNEVKPEWTTYPLTSQLALIEDEFRFAPTQIDADGCLDTNLRDSERRADRVENLAWEQSKQLLKIYGRFFAPFGVEQECVAQFIWNPCYSDNLESCGLNVHVLPKFIQGEASIGRLGVDKWQKEDIFAVGKIVRGERWQPYFLEPLVIFTSSQEGEDFHNILMNRVGEAHDLYEGSFEFLSESFGIEKATAVNDLVVNSVVQILKERCWERPIELIRTTTSALSDFARIIELSAQTPEQVLQSALLRVVYSRAIHTSLEEVREDIRGELSLAQVKRQVLRRNDAIVSELVRLLALPDHLDESKLVTYYETVREVLDNLGTALVKKQWNDSRQRYEVMISVRLKGQNQPLQVEMGEDELLNLLSLLKESESKLPKS